MFILNCVEEEHSAKVTLGRRYYYAEHCKILTADKAKICC